MMSQEAEELAKAAQYYKNALKTYPRVAAPQNNLYYKMVDIYDKLEQKDKALDTLRLHALHNNKSFDGFVKYAERLVKHGEEIKAIEAFMNANYIFPFDSKVHNSCGSLMLKNSQLDGALREFRVAVEIEPRDKEALVGLVECYIKLEKSEEAKTYFDRLKRFHGEEDFSELEKKLSEGK